MFTLERSLGYLIVIVLPVILVYLCAFKGKAFIIYTILSVAFTAGSLELLFNISSNLIRQFMELLIWGLAAFVFLVSSKKEIPGWRYLVGFFIVCLISFLINDVTIVQLLLFLRMFFRIVAIFVLFHHIQLNLRTADKLTRFIILLFITQIFVSIGKYLMIGQTEPVIGTMSVLGGSLSAVFSLVGISFAFSAYLFEKKWRYLMLIVGFFLIPVASGAKGMIFFMAALLLIQYFYFWKRGGFFSFARILKLLPLLAFIFLLVYVGIRLNPQLNPERQIGGSFDPDYVINHIDSYLNPGRPIRGAEYFGRGEAPYAVYTLLREYGLVHLLFGLGPGDIIMSRYTFPRHEIHWEEGITAMKYGIGYGARTGLLFTALQVGLLGLIFYFLLITKMFKRMMGAFYQPGNISKTRQIFLLGLIGSYWIFVLDFLFYSRTFTEWIQILVPVFFAYHYVLSLERNKDDTTISRGSPERSFRSVGTITEASHKLHACKAEKRNLWLGKWE